MLVKLRGLILEDQIKVRLKKKHHLCHSFSICAKITFSSHPNIPFSEMSHPTFRKIRKCDQKLFKNGARHDYSTP